MIGLLMATLLSAGPFPGIDSTSDYLVYYGSWDSDRIFRAQDFDLVVLEPSNITSEQLNAIRAGHDGVIGTDDDVIVLAYVSIGEVSNGDITGNGMGPCYYDDQGDSIVYEHRGYASFYLDDRDHDGYPDRNGAWGSYYVNAGDTAWWNFVESEADAAFAKGADGLFLDTIDTASPWGNYGWTAHGMSTLIQHLRDRYPDKYFMANRGLFYFDPHQPAFAWNIRPFINGVMFECYYTEWDWNNNRGIVSPYFSNNRDYWAYYINQQAHQSDGFTVFALDYLNPEQSDYETLLANQIQVTIVDQGWVDYVSEIYLDDIYYGVFHHHPDGDRNPPTWDNVIGLGLISSESTSVTLRWGTASDQSEPVRFNVYYSQSEFNDPSEATDTIRHVNAINDPYGNYVWRYTIHGLSPNTTYYFMVRAEDSANPPHEDQNRVVRSVTTGSGSSSTGIVIDGVFDDWATVPLLDTVYPENSGDASSADGDLVDMWATSDTENLYFSYQVAGNIDFNGYFYHIFIDTDMSQATGYRGPDGNYSIGADYMVENGGLWHYSGSGGSSWSWESAGNIQYAISGDRIELAIPLFTIGLSPSSGIWVLFNDNLASPPYSLVDIAPNEYTLYHYPVVVTSIDERSEKHPDTGPVRIAFSHGRLAVRTSESSRLSVIDIAGRKVKEVYLVPGLNEIELNLPAGVYIVTAESVRWRVSRKVIVLR